MDNAGAAWSASASSILLSILSRHQTVEILNQAQGLQYSVI